MPMLPITASRRDRLRWTMSICRTKRLCKCFRKLIIVIIIIIITTTIIIITIIIIIIVNL